MDGSRPRSESSRTSFSLGRATRIAESNGTGVQMDTVWRYTIRAANGNRLLMRIAQILDTQFLIPLQFEWVVVSPGEVKILLRIACTDALAIRVQAKLLHLQDVSSVSVDSERV
jgi:hypothetical protein